MRLNQGKCTFRVQADKFLWFMLTHKWIEVNLNNFQKIIDTRSSTSVKEVEELTRRLAALSEFLFCANDKSIHLFSAIRNLAEFNWTEECGKAFTEVKQFLSSPPIIYLYVSEKVVSSMLVQDGEISENSVYFVCKVLKGAKIRYQKIEKLVLSIVTTAQKLRHYFQGHLVTIKTNYPIKHILKKPNLAGRMVS